MSEESPEKTPETTPEKTIYPLMSDGTIRFRVRRRDGTETTHYVDLLVLKVTCEACEDAHQLTVKNDRIQPTVEFLQDLAGRLSGCGLDNCTPTLAWQAWIAASEAMSTLKNVMSETPN